MALSKKPVNSNMGQSGGQSSGWAAFDRKQREKQGSGPTSDSDPFPSITSRASSGPTKRVLANHCTPARTYSAVPPSLQFSLPTGNYNGVIPRRSASEKNGNKQISTESIAHPVKLLSRFHSWADQSLIEDILAAVNNDVDQASILLRAMVSPDAEIKESTLPGTSSSSLSYCSDSKNKCSGESGLVENKSNAVHQVLISSQLFSVPVEPEWEEDDVYLSHRKDAIKMIRMASQHSRAANNAFLRGDHDSAQHHSSRAREGWTVAEKLNAEASTEILRIRNINNGMWKLDLHGLHATEAVGALKDHLHKIESQTATRHPATATATDITASLEALSCLDVDIKAKDNNMWRDQRPSVLDVITGRGNHSREEAALPIAVRSFLIENGYRFEDVRPGVIGVRPKFRYK